MIANGTFVAKFQSQDVWFNWFCDKEREKNWMWFISQQRKGKKTHIFKKEDHTTCFHSNHETNSADQLSCRY